MRTVCICKRLFSQQRRYTIFFVSEKYILNSLRYSIHACIHAKYIYIYIYICSRSNTWLPQYILLYKLDNFLHLHGSWRLNLNWHVFSNCVQVDGVSVIDRQAATHNAEVDALLLVGMVAVTVGCSVLTAALLSRAFCSGTQDARPFR